MSSSIREDFSPVNGLSPAQLQWVRSVFDGFDLDAKLGQLLHPMLTHYDAEADQQRLIRQIIEYQMGGAFLFCRSSRVLREIVKQVLPEMQVPLLLSGDYEAGANTIEDGTRFGSSLAFAGIADLAAAERLAYQAGKAAALQGAAVGARWSFAPVADINCNPENPITNTRSYGDDVGRICALSCAYLRGMQDYGMAACLKHFPGDGVDARDQHLVTSVNSLSMEEWARTFGQTFRAGIAAGVHSIMMGHIALADVSGRDVRTGRLLPATLDPRIQIDLLRGQLGFSGLIISDAIVMGGVRHFGRTEADLVVGNIASGSDMVLFVSDVPSAMQALRRAIDEERLGEDRVDDAVLRVLALKAKLNLISTPELPSDAEAADIFSSEAFSQEVAEVGERCVTLVRDENDVYPLQLSVGGKVVLYHLPLETTDIPALLVGEQADQSLARSAMHEALIERGYRVATVFEPQGYQREIEDADVLIYVFYSGPQAGRGSMRLAQKALQFIDRERIQSKFPVLFLSLGNPYIIWELSWMENFVCGYSRSDNIQRAYVRALLGEIPFQGKLPVTLPNWL